MFFNSYLFIFVFLPLFLICWHLVGTNRPSRLPLCLLAASLLFYGLFNALWLLLLLGVILGNYALGVLLQHAAVANPDDQKSRRRRILLVCALIFNLAILIWYKYSWFLLQNIALLLHADWRFTPPEFPLGISFYIFMQIAWLASLYKAEIPFPSLREHLLFSCAFPYIISGPIVRARQMTWQYAGLRPIASANLAPGLTLFTIGLAKKTLLADSLGFYADAVFSAAGNGWALSAAEAWAGSLCYTFQLYFDFSGYTDMALGLGLMIGLQLPENFNSPYKAAGIIDFWRRWHITLSAWLRDYLYIPLGGNRHGRPRQYSSLFLTMLLGGLWHGAGWTYILWGGMHGAMLCVNHGFRAFIRHSRSAQYFESAPFRLFSILLTFFLINLAWVVFRAPSLDAAWLMHKTMFGGVPASPELAGGEAAAIADIFAIYLPNRYFSGWRPFALLCAACAICWLMPNSGQILRGEGGMINWRPGRGWSVAMAALAFFALACLSRQSAFLYFQF